MSNVTEFYLIVRFIALAIVHIAFAWYVYRDAQSRTRLLFDTPAWLWALIILPLGLIGVLIYWIGNSCKLFSSQTITDFDESESNEDERKS